MAKAADLDGATIGVQSGTTGELNIADFFRKTGKKFTPVTIEDTKEFISALELGRVDVGMTDRQRLTGVELPLLFPVILTGVRIVLVQNIGLATHHCSADRRRQSRRFRLSGHQPDRHGPCAAGRRADRGARFRGSGDPRRDYRVDHAQGSAKR